jgi:hypothetical protein
VAATKTTVAHGSTVKLYGTVTPTILNSYVYLQQKAGTAWKTLAVKGKVVKQRMPNGKTLVGYILTIKTSSKGKFAYRAYRPATSTNVAGASPSLLLSVT